MHVQALPHHVMSEHKIVARIMRRCFSAFTRRVRDRRPSGTQAVARRRIDAALPLQ
jgi:hypothetical protein